MSDEKIPSTLAEYRDEYIPAYDAGWRAACLECAEIAEREAVDWGPWDAPEACAALRDLASRYRQMAEGGDEQEERHA